LAVAPFPPSPQTDRRRQLPGRLRAYGCSLHAAKQRGHRFRNAHAPGLGDIPLIGHAFHLEKSSSAKTDFYIVITPHIVRHVDVAAGQ